jgi:hypothetical protein
VIAAAWLSLPVMAAAQAGQADQETPVAGTPLRKQPAKHKAIYGTTRTPSTMTPNVDDSAYHGHFTLPEFAPDYHGGIGS